ncbi:glycosyl transferase family 2 [Sorangium cellulosum]|uniref:Glycosyl transferase family 2 n=1 Tax=Sorangium cellulosum TaxID=56 RepID=A0A2L0EMW5_SORCE|nr:glycosyltransferase family 2 protein [Sorangium cellulosum]AUX40636.1 glycosyl transferase family 2 [Sorangium cellulosum]
MDRATSAPRGARLWPRPLAERPRCSIIVPCYNEERYIEATLRGALGQRYPEDLLEILVVDGGSTDRTREIVARVAAEHPRVTLLHNPARIQAAAMNLGIRRSRGEVIVRMDAHADYAPDYVAASVAVLRRTSALNAGGAARPRHQGGFQRALCAALSSPLGVGGSAYRDPSREGFVESVWGGAFRREAFEIAGLYDPAAITNEDAELNQRIIEAGGAVYLSREIVAHYYPRASLGALARQYFAYGAGRARTLLRRRKLLSLRPIVPFCMVTAFALLALAAALLPAARPLLAAASLAYAALVIAESLRLAQRAPSRDFALLCAIFPAMHAAHGLGFWAGLLRGARDRADRREAERLPAR